MQTVLAKIVADRRFGEARKQQQPLASFQMNQPSTRHFMMRSGARVPPLFWSVKRIAKRRDSR